ncbi:hypothetical protein [Natronoglycomyces albus]|uniref:Integral membrane protein n=1 Tax=Natronoglycomyces albus TaxID=2811108 RepID=A0A895XXX9_9ACTN|nr:hypothetical protein [Natronoglycomyces albus]QSB06478.1 hypothetical protein JQS30_06135 [Natronoglycomyces albus]
MTSWLDLHVVQTDRLPLFTFLVALVVTFAFIRLSVRLIRAEVKWWPGNVTPGGLHIHHVVFGVVFMLIGGVTSLAVPPEMEIGRAIAGALFGIGAALVLDEFALILHLKDVYWSEKGRTSIDAVFVAIAITGLLLIGLRPIGVVDFIEANADVDASNPVLWAVGFTVLNLSFAVVTLLKGKIWTGLVGLFVPPLIYVGAARLARPGSPWAHWFYRAGRPRGLRKMRRAVWRERRLRRPLIEAKIAVQEFIGGRHDHEPPH